MLATALPATEARADAPTGDAAYLRQALNLHIGEFIRLRREIHSEPELAFEEHRTAALVADCLERWGYAVERGVGGTGVVGRLTRGTGAKRLGLRADMDALPIAEASGVAWSSRRPGVMHACGHDGHTAMLLAAARRLAEHGQFDGTLQLIFQPAEEGGGGALRMIEDGLFERYPCDAVFAMHNMPGLPQGQLMFRDGPAMASSDYASVTLTGVGGHGAMPHKATDTVVAAASVVMALQTVVSRNVDPRRWRSSRSAPSMRARRTTSFPRRRRWRSACVHSIATCAPRCRGASRR
jgi:hippurate hydrolase